jgi:hypothetical protein
MMKKAMVAFGGIEVCCHVDFNSRFWCRWLVQYRSDAVIQQAQQ